ncbi:MAG: O-linked N-acetylglucosamine transferase family protein, partial [Candidatus Xenobia bacterium]
TLFYVGPPGPVDTRLFRAVHQIHMVNYALDVSKLRDNNFAMVYYPDIGMHAETIFLSNARLAPIQVTSYGHSVSTFGADIDYWIGGAEAERIERAEENYSERLVLLPGLGITNVRPEHVPGGRAPRADRCVVNCSWYPQKVNHPLLLLLKQILDKCEVDVLFRFFSGGGIQVDNACIPFARSIAEVVGEAHVEVLSYQKFEDYLDLMEEGQFSLEPYHFGGCNTVVDSLYVRRPVVCFEGDRWYNRIGSAILRRVGLQSLIATTAEEYVELARRLIQDQTFRKRIMKKCEQIDLDKQVFEASEADDFVRAIDFLMQNQPRLQAENSRRPIVL